MLFLNVIIREKTFFFLLWNYSENWVFSMYINTLKFTNESHVVSTLLNAACEMYNTSLAFTSANVMQIHCPDANNVPKLC